jgi:hypothetical protein
MKVGRTDDGKKDKDDHGGTLNEGGTLMMARKIRMTMGGNKGEDGKKIMVVTMMLITMKVQMLLRAIRMQRRRIAKVMTIRNMIGIVMVRKIMRLKKKKIYDSDNFWSIKWILQ